LSGAPAPRPPNLPPRTNPGSLGIQKSVKTDLMDVQVDAKIVADGNGGDRPKTSFTHSHNRIRWPQYQADAHDKIVRLIGKVIWHDTITIQTVYPAGARPDQLSGYGRGTTQDDIRNGDVTLGFHESRHRNDYVAYLKAHLLPDPPKPEIGMTVTEYEKAAADFEEKLNAYYKDMDAESVAETDEVGYRKSTYESTGEPFRHVLPGR